LGAAAAAAAMMAGVGRLMGRERWERVLTAYSPFAEIAGFCGTVHLIEMSIEALGPVRLQLSMLQPRISRSRPLTNMMAANGQLTQVPIKLKAVPIF